MRYFWLVALSFLVLASCDARKNADGEWEFRKGGEATVLSEEVAIRGGAYVFFAQELQRTAEAGGDDQAHARIRIEDIAGGKVAVAILSESEFRKYKDLVGRRKIMFAGDRFLMPYDPDGPKVNYEARTVSSGSQVATPWVQLPPGTWYFLAQNDSLRHPISGNLKIDLRSR